MNWLRRAMKKAFCIKHLLFVICHLSFVIASSFAATVDVDIYVRPGHNIPPQSVTDLTAETGSNIGEIDLIWTAPQTTWNIDLRWFYIRYSTLSVNDVPFLGDTTAWWNSANVYEISNWWKPGDKINLTIGGLIPHTTYYFSIKAEDEFGNVSDFDTKTNALNQANALVLWDKVQPAGITTLVAETGNVEGEVKLRWISPGDDGTEGNLTGKFRIDYATFSGYQFQSSNFKLQISTENCKPLSSLSYVLTGLDAGVTYYFRIWALDEIPNCSDISNGATAYAQIDVTPPDIITDIIGQSGYNSIRLYWTSTGDDGTKGKIVDGEFQIKYSTLNTLSSYQVITLSTSSLPGEKHYYTVTGLDGDTTYYFRIRVADERGNYSLFSDTITVWTFDNVPPVPVTFIQALKGDKQVELVWSASVSDDVANYKLYCSTDLSTFQLINVSTFTAYTDTGLKNLVTYWYFVKAVDFYGNESSSSPVVFAVPETGDYIAPLPPYNIRGEIINGKFRISWSVPSYNEDDTLLDDLGGFRIYRSTSLWNKGNIILTVSSFTTHYDFDISSYTVYYRIIAIDNATPYPNESEVSFVLDNNVNLYFVKDNFVVEFPEITQDNLENYVLKVDTVSSELKESIFSCDLELIKGSNFKEKITDVFNYPEIILSYYYGRGNKVIRKANSVNNGTISFFWFNGLKWVMVGGEDDNIAKKISLKTRRFGRYEVRYSYRGSKFILHTVYPKIFTPNGDGKNDIVEFQYENIEGYAVTGKIFDIKGRFISNLKIGPDSSSVSGSLIWDGKDSKGNICESGVYIYELQAGGEIYNGTVILAK